MTTLSVFVLGAMFGGSFGALIMCVFAANGDDRWQQRYRASLPVAHDDPTLIRHPNHERALRAVNAERN